MYGPTTSKAARLGGIVMLVAIVSNAYGQTASQTTTLPKFLEFSVNHTQIAGRLAMSSGPPFGICFELTIVNRADKPVSYDANMISLQIDGQRKSPFTGQAGVSRMTAEGRPRLPLRVEIPRKGAYPTTRPLNRVPRLGAGTLAPNQRTSGWLAYELPPIDIMKPRGAEPLFRECLVLIPIGPEMKTLDLLESELDHSIKTRRCIYDSSIPVVEIGSRINALNVHRLIDVYESMQKSDQDFVILFTSEALLIDCQIGHRLRSVRPTTEWVRRHACWTNIPGKLVSRVHSQLVGGMMRMAESEAAAMADILGGRDNGHELLIQKLTDSSVEVRVEATWQLSRLCNSPGVVQALEKAVADEEAAVRRAAVSSLYTYYRGTRRSASPDAETEMPPALRNDALQQILDVADDTAAEVRSAAIRLLGLCRDSRAELAVVRATSDSDVKVRRAAVGSLRDSESPQAAQILLDALNDDDASIRLAAVASVAGHSAGTFGKLVMERLGHDDISLVMTASRTLGTLRFEPAVPRLRELLRHENLSVARTAAEALEQLGVLTDADTQLLKREMGVILKPIPDAATINKLLTPEQLAVSEAVTNSIGMVLVPIPAGEFLMGSPRDNNQHRVRITKQFYIGAFEVTETQFAKVMGTPRRALPPYVTSYGGPNKPVSRISHDLATTFCQKLSDLPEEMSANREYRLPTEAQWEYACRAGTTATYSFGNDPSQLNEHAWYSENSGRRRRSVAQRSPNPWALYDMYGNMVELCLDWLGEYPQAPIAIDPVGPDKGARRVYRGGGWPHSAESCTSATRNSMRSPAAGDTRGFRIVMIMRES